jgi:hypothetical protein
MTPTAEPPPALTVNGLRQLTTPKDSLPGSNEAEKSNTSDFTAGTTANGKDRKTQPTATTG